MNVDRMLDEITSEQFAEWIAWAGLKDGVPVEEAEAKKDDAPEEVPPSGVLDFLKERFKVIEVPKHE